MPVKPHLQSEASRKTQFLIYLPGSVNLGHKFLSWRRTANNGVFTLGSQLMARGGLQCEPLAKLLNIIAVFWLRLLNDINSQGQ